MKHYWLTFIIIFLGVLAVSAQQPPTIHQQDGINEWRFTRPVNYSDCDFIALVKYAEITVTVPQYTYEYDGTAHTPAIVKIGDRVLSLANGDYRYSDNVNAGKVSVYVRNGGGEAVFANVFEIVKKELKIVWSNTSLEYNGCLQKPTAYIDADGYQFPVDVTGEQIMPGTYTATANANISSNYRIVGGLTKAFTIAPRTVTITADAKSKTYGDPDPALTYTVSGLLDGDVVSGELTRIPGEDVGVYAIKQGAFAASADYFGELIKRLYDNTLCADNHEHLYTSFRWRNNGSDLDGEANQYLHRDDLNGYYTAIVTLAADRSREVESCPYYIDKPVSKNATASTVAVYPNPAIGNSQLTIEILDYDPDDDYLIYINNNTGTLVKTITNSKQINTLSLPSGSYSGVLLRSGIKSGFKIIVK